MGDHLFDALFPFGGSGGGALGFLDAEVRLLGNVGRFRCLGSIDFDAEACVDFGRFTGAPAWCVDVETITAAEIVERYGARAPAVVFMSPPCKGSSRLLSSAKAATEKYQRMNRLAVVWTKAMLEAWGDDPPALLLLENVPGLPTRAAGMLKELRALLRRAGYVFHASAHDCGEIGGLAQHRDRYLLVARHPKKCAPLLYQPPKRRVRGVGEVLGELPMPATEAARAWGELHTMPRLSWKNWLRLALIPAGGDWRDLEGVLQGRARREVFRRHPVQAWDEPAPAVTGPGGMSLEAVADPRASSLAMRPRDWGGGTLGITPWDRASGTIAGEALPANGRFSIADPRVALPPSDDRHHNKHAVVAWDEPAPTVIGKPQPSSGGAAVADVRVGRAFDAGYGVLAWDQPARTIAGDASAGCGAYAVADARERGFLEAVRILTLDEAMALELDPTKPPPFVPVIIAEDGTWHRPMTPLELAALQGYPTTMRGEPVRFEGGRTLVVEHIGNSVPPPAARAVAERMLFALLESALGAFSLGGGLEVWVEPEEVSAA
jgi:site-specific DNA-cytosine methylase